MKAKTGVSLKDLFDADFCQMNLAQKFRENIFIIRNGDRLELTS